MATTDMVVFIGLEIHVQLNSIQKLFCTCSTLFGDEPNSNVCPICLGYPGVLPALNTDAMRKAYIVARALNCTLSTTTAFARKNYFYPDLPKNYQISQFAAPLGRAGEVEGSGAWGGGVEAREGGGIGVREIHLEEDAGKMIHSGDISLLDFNRTGTPLLEIVTNPDVRSAIEAERLLQQIQQIVRYLGVSDGNMEEGSLRCDANISIALTDQSDASSAEPPLPDYKVEIKNINSSRFVRLALEYEITRQRALVQSKQRPTQETRLWNENHNTTIAMRSKEESMDYRYFPEPDLPVFTTSPQFLSSVEAGVVELPRARARRMAKQYDLSADNAGALCADKQTADYFEECVAAGAPPHLTHRWLFSEVRKQLNKRGGGIARTPITPARLAELLRLLANGDVHGKIAKQILAVMAAEDKGAQQIIAERKWKTLTAGDLRNVTQQVIDENPKAAERIRAGDKKSIGFLMGQVMRKSDGQADPAQAKTLLQALLDA